MSWQDLMQVEEKGRWWLVGAGWSGEYSAIADTCVPPLPTTISLSSLLHELV